MHIPDQMLQGAVCPVTAGMSLIGATAAVADPVLTTILAGLAGALLTFALAWLLGTGLRRRQTAAVG
jgi:hypothetical protein